MSVRDLLVELGTEELPPLALRELENAFAEGIRNGLSAAGIGFTALKSYATPRRLAVLISALAETQPTMAQRRRGPPVKDGSVSCHPRAQNDPAILRLAHVGMTV